MTELGGTIQSPRNEAEVAACARAAHETMTGLIPTGAPVAPPTLPGDEARCVVSFHGMDQIIAHDAQDLVVTVQPGVPIAELEALLLAKNQRLAIEAPSGDWTLGGLIAGRSTGFLQSTFGPPRDQVLGLRFVTSKGDLGKTGGRVVKNVTGYDLAKLFCGSHGALAMLTELSFRLRPVSAAARTVVMGRDSLADALSLAMSLRSLPGQITGMIVTGGIVNTSQAEPWCLALRLEGAAAAVSDGVSSVRNKVGSLITLADDEEQDYWTRAAAFPESQGFHAAIGLRPSRIAPAIETLIRSAETDQYGVVADVLGGRLSFTLPEPVRDVDTTVGQLLLGRLGTDLEAHISIPSDPRDLIERHNRFGAPPVAVRDLLRRIKKAFDPAGLMGQGRDHLVQCP